MSDPEWDRWKATWNRADKPMSDVVKRARTDRRKAVVALLTIHVVGAANIAFAGPGERSRRTWPRPGRRGGC